MLRSSLVCAGLSLAVMLGAYAAGCGGDDEVPDETGAQPPGPPEGAPSASGSGQAWAINRLFLGGTDRSGMTNAKAWKQYGYNLDLKISDDEAKYDQLCKPAKGGPKSVHEDGDNGIDNSFGSNLWPIIQGLASDAEASINESLIDGDFTIIVNMENLGPEPSLLNITSKLYAGSGIVGGMAPAWDGNDEWEVAPELLSNPTDITSAKVVFPSSYTNDNVWVSGTKGDLTLAVSVQGFELNLNIGNAVITMELDAAHTSAKNGIIAGILPTEGLIDELRKVAGSFDESLCGGSTFESLADQLRQASDIMADGSQDPNSECNGISVGLGFEAAPVKLGGIAPGSEAAADPCKCGDNVMDPGEECDDGNKMGGDGCDPDCKIEMGTGGGGGAGTGGAGGAGTGGAGGN